MFTAKSVLLRRQKEAYAEFSKKAELLPRIERTQVYGFDRSQSSKATWAARKSSADKGLTSGAPGGKMKYSIEPHTVNTESASKIYTHDSILNEMS